MFDAEFFGRGLVAQAFYLIDSILWIYMWAVIIRVVLSWVRPDPYNPIVRFLYSMTDPPLDAIRRKMPSFLWASGLDFSPLVLIALISVARLFIRSFRF